jgi:hypothetical protein
MHTKWRSAYLTDCHLKNICLFMLFGVCIKSGYQGINAVITIVKDMSSKIQSLTGTITHLMDDFSQLIDSLL